MPASDWKNMLKQFKKKPGLKARYIRYCKPKDRKNGITVNKCTRCGRFGAHIKKYGLHLCRHCFREVAVKIGFQKYS